MKLAVLAGGVVSIAGLIIGTPACKAADVWGGSVAVTSDYLVRGITRTYNQGAAQIDLHYLNSSGFIAGLFASNTQFEGSAPKIAELSEFLGWTWASGNDWREKILYNHYAYPFSPAGSGYEYDELDLDATYHGWLDFNFTYSPNSPRFLRQRGLFDTSSSSAEVNVQRRAAGKLSATAGIGYSYVSGPKGAGYGYASLGAAFDLAPVSLAISYVDTTGSAKSLYYDAAARGRWTATVIWRF